MIRDEERAGVPRDSHGLVEAARGLGAYAGEGADREGLAHALRVRASALQVEWDRAEPGHALSPRIAPQAELLYDLAEELAAAPAPDAAAEDLLQAAEAEVHSWLDEQAGRYAELPGTRASQVRWARRRTAIIAGCRA